MFENPPWRLKLMMWTLNITTISLISQSKYEENEAKNILICQSLKSQRSVWVPDVCLNPYIFSVAVSVASAIVPVNADLSRTETITTKHAFIRAFHCYWRFKWIVLFYCWDMQSSRSHQPWQCDCNGSEEVQLLLLHLCTPLDLKRRKKGKMLNIQYDQANIRHIVTQK